MNVEVGQEVVIQYRNGRPRRTVIEKVARKYFYVRGERDGYDKETGQGQDGYSHAIPLAKYERLQAVGKARKELRDFGVQLSPWEIDGEKVLAIRAALNDLMAPTHPIGGDT